MCDVQLLSREDIVIPCILCIIPFLNTGAPIIVVGRRKMRPVRACGEIQSVRGNLLHEFDVECNNFSLVKGFSCFGRFLTSL